MKFYTKRIFLLLTFVIGAMLLPSCRSKTPWNPYLSAKEKPSDKQRKEEDKQIKSGTKAYKELMKKNKKEIKDNNDAFFSKKKQYKKTTKIKRRRKGRKENWKL